MAQFPPTQSRHDHLADLQPGPTSGHLASNNGNPSHLQRQRHWAPEIRPTLPSRLCACSTSLESLQQSMGRVEGTSPPHHLFFTRDSQGGVPKLSRFGLPPLCGVKTFFSYLRLGWNLKQTFSSRWELSNGVLHSTYTHRCRVDCWLLVVESQIASLTPDLSFCHNFCYICPNGSCKPIFDIFILISFQWYKEHLNARCFDPCNRTLKFWESRQIPKSPFRECESHLPTLPKVGLRHRFWKCSANL